MSEQFDVIVSGHLCLDMIPEMDNVPLDALATPGHLFETGPLIFATGGAVSNTGQALHHLGVKAGLMSTIGDDMLGQTILSLIRARGAQLTDLITVRPGHTSSYTIVLAPQKADRTFLHHAGPNNTFGLNDIDFTKLEKTRIFHLGYPPLLPRLVAQEGRELQEVCRRARAAGAITTLDTTLPDPESATGRADWKTILASTLPYVDIFIPSIEEIIFMLRRADFEAWRGNVLRHLTRHYLSALADELLSFGVAVTGFKLSEMGFYLKTSPAERIASLTRHLPLDAQVWGGVELWQPAFKVDVVGTIGAGDSAYAGFLKALLCGMPPLEAIRRACAVGACNVEAADSISGVRSWEETEVRLRAGWPLHTRRLPGA